MELFRLQLKDTTREVLVELNELEVAFIATRSFFHRRNLALGKKIMQLLAASNKCTLEQLIDNWDRLYKR